jgi:S-adenosylmethionine hydrolase
MSSAHRPHVIALLSDFGGSDWYVAEMKGVLLTHAPGAPLVDITHEIPPGDVPRAAFVLARAHAAFPLGTVFLAVVDPGVGTARHPIAIHAGGRYYVGPDNGVFEAAFDLVGAETRVIEDASLLERASETFHGRDVFAPVAARIALRAEPAWREVGRQLTAPARLAPALAEGADHAHAESLAHAAESGRLLTRVAHVDRFGNAITALHELEFEAWLGGQDPSAVIFVAHGARGARVTEVRGLTRTYGEATRGPIALVGSSGLIELALPGAHAGLALGLAPGDTVELRHEGDG